MQATNRVRCTPSLIIRSHRILVGHSFLFQIVDGSVVCDGCGYPVCSVECSVNSVHTDECAVLNTIPGTHYAVVTPLRLLRLWQSGRHQDRQIGEDG